MVLLVKLTVYFMVIFVPSNMHQQSTRMSGELLLAVYSDLILASDLTGGPV